jgi:tyrosine-protein kinase
VILTTVVVAGGSVVFSLQEQHVYRASVQVLLNRRDIAAAVTNTPQNPALSEDPGRYAATQASIARSQAVAHLALATAGLSGRTVRAFLDKSSVTPSPTADTLDFQVDDTNPAIAARLVNAYTAAFVSYKLQLDTTAIKNARRQLNRQIAALRASGDRTSAEYRDLVNSEQQLHTMELLQSRDAVLSHPTAGLQIRPTPKRDALLGVAFGLLLGVGLAFALDAVDRRIRSEEEVEEVLHLPLLGQLPRPPRDLRDRFALSMIDDPQSPHADAVRRLATGLSFASPDRPAQILMITSAVQREGKSTTLANLAVALARAGNQVAVVDLDLRQPTIASLFGIHQLDGLTDVAVRRSTLDKALVQIDLPDPSSDQLPTRQAEASSNGSLFVLPSGPLPASAGEFVGSEAVASLVLDPLRDRFDYVLVDTPPIGVVADAAILMARVDAVIAIARVGVVQRPQLRDLQRQLTARPAVALGVVVTGVEAAAAYGYSPYFAAAERQTTPTSENGANPAATPARPRAGRIRRART